MIERAKRIVVVAGCFFCLAGCETTSMKLPDFFASKDGDTSASIEKSAEADATGSVSAPGPDLAVGSGEQTDLLGKDPNDNLNLAKRHFRAQDYGQAERYFRHAVELAPRDSEAWLGLAASYDRLRRFDLADRAYAQLLKLLGPTPEVLNNQGYSYMLRGDYRRARQILLQAQARAPDNPYVRNNLDLLARSQINRKGIE